METKTYLEITDVELSAGHGDVAGLPHVVRAVEPAQQLAVLHDDEDGRGHGVHGHDVALPGDGEPRHDVDVADGDLPDEVSVLGEDLHPAPLVAAVADHELAAGLHDGHLPAHTPSPQVQGDTDPDPPGVPQLPLLLARHPELVAVRPILLENLNPATATITNNNNTQNIDEEKS